MAPHKRSGHLTSSLIRSMGDMISWSGIGDGRICIVNYHRILKSFDPLLESEPDIESFRWQMQVLAECFNVLPVHDALHALATHSLPPRAVCITFDDGYRSIHDFALPILKEFNLPATVFVTTGYIDAGNMWNDRILEAIRAVPNSQIDLRDMGLNVYQLQTINDRKRAINMLTEDAKYLPPEERQDLISKLEHLSGAVFEDRLMLSREMLCALVDQGIEIGAHTISHPILTRLDNSSARHEIEGGKKQLEKIIAKPVRLFAYPNGKTGVDFDERHVAMARDAGFDAAFTTAFGAVTEKDNLYQIPRCRPWDATAFFYALRLLRLLAH